MAHEFILSLVLKLTTILYALCDIVSIYTDIYTDIFCHTKEKAPCKSQNAFNSSSGVHLQRCKWGVNCCFFSHKTPYLCAFCAHPHILPQQTNSTFIIFILSLSNFHFSLSQYVQSYLYSDFSDLFKPTFKQQRTTS